MTKKHQRKKIRKAKEVEIGKSFFTNDFGKTEEVKYGWIWFWKERIFNHYKG